MLILKRKLDQRIFVTTPAGERIIIRLHELGPQHAKLAIYAPEDFVILREELEPPTETPR